MKHIKIKHTGRLVLLLEDEEGLEEEDDVGLDEAFVVDEVEEGDVAFWRFLSKVVFSDEPADAEANVDAVEEGDGNCDDEEDTVGILFMQDGSSK